MASSEHQTQSKFSAISGYIQTSRSLIETKGFGTHAKPYRGWGKIGKLIRGGVSYPLVLGNDKCLHCLLGAIKFNMCVD